MRRRNRIIIAVLASVIVALVIFVVWAETPLGPMPEASAALQSDSSVKVSTDRWLVFEPANSSTHVGYIIYPGGRVDPRSYAPLAHSIAAEGYLVVIAPMPLNLAIFGVGLANDIIQAYPNITTWAIGGHSLGGTMAAQFVSQNGNEIRGLILMAAYPGPGVDLSKMNISVVTIHGTNDGLVSTSQIQDSLGVLPPGTVDFEIAGGNHGQFGYYGPQPGDNNATISRELQQQQTVNATVELLKEL